MRRHVSRLVLAIGLAVPVALLGAGTAQAAAPAAPTQVATDVTATDVSASIWGQFREDGVRIRTGPGLQYGVAGLGYRNHSVTVHCFVAPEPNHSWYYLTDNTTGVTGWVSSSLVYREAPLNGC
ncbi:SH3 domain-containing protein [Streptomyces specialis]|uniref:SH3 domain-containing protein n=1 Tax=Streptomyces specialis TaxID=498367 RepID=UPI00073F6AB5|nr:SH3 domain-containing protein [Streptomyces specialis]